MSGSVANDVAAIQTGRLNARAIVRNPREAAQAFGSQPKQRNVFVVRFYPNGSQTGADGALLTSLTFIAKTAERPKVNTKSEELHQYNKKRQVYTGFKLEPVRIQFYDDAQSSALTMWQNYVNYYFGDFTGVVSNNNVGSYGYDVIAAQMQSMNYGFTAAQPDGTGDFFFNRIEIYHFFDQMYDVYQLINPRITIFDPDDLDYSNSEVSLISMSVVYENLQFAFTQFVANGDINGAPFLEFTADTQGGQSGTFNGNVIAVAQPNTAISTDAPAFTPPSSSTPVPQLLAAAQGAVSGVNANYYRYVGSPSTGPLGQYGNYQYAPTAQQSLAALAQANQTLATALDMGASSNPLAITGVSLQAMANTLARRGVNSAQLDIASAQANSVTTGQGTATNLLTKAILASNALTGTNNSRSIITPNGVAMTTEGYGAINAQQNGTAQYGFNTNAQPNGTSSGYTGPLGYQGPVGQENNGPYSGNLPNGLYGRYGIAVPPLGPIGMPQNPVAAA